MTVKAYFHQVKCPECQLIMMVNLNNTLSCGNYGCRMHNKQYKLPTIELTEYDNQENPTNEMSA